MDYLERNQSPSLIFLTENETSWATEGDVYSKYVPHTHKLLFWVKLSKITGKNSDTFFFHKIINLPDWNPSHWKIQLHLFDSREGEVFFKSCFDYSEALNNIFKWYCGSEK